MVDILHKPLQVKKLRYLIDKLHLIWFYSKLYNNAGSVRN